MSKANEKVAPVSSNCPNFSNEQQTSKQTKMKRNNKQSKQKAIVLSKLLCTTHFWVENQNKRVKKKRVNSHMCERIYMSG